MAKSKKVRITITISEDTYKAVEKLGPLHQHWSKSQIIEQAIMSYCIAIIENASKEANNEHN